MTAEEAIKELRDASDNEVRYGDTEHHYNEVMKRIEAFDMVIKALEQQPCEDCISRKLLSDNICEGISCNECSFNEIDGESGCLLQKRFDELPSVTPKAEQKWIPCEERLPEEGGDYLVTTKWEGSYSGDTYIETNMAVYREKLEEWDCKDVIAWMPLPKPYKAESEG